MVVKRGAARRRASLVAALLVAACNAVCVASADTAERQTTRLLFRHAATAAGTPDRHATLADHLASVAPSPLARRRLLGQWSRADRRLLGAAPPPLALGSLGAAVAVDYADVPAADVDWVLQALTSHPDAHFAERDGVVRAAVAPNDPLLADQTHLIAAGLYTDSLAGSVGGKPPAQGAWNRTAGSPDVVVCVMDSGIDTAHPDLAPSLWVNTGEVPGNLKDDDGNGYVDDVHGVSTYGPGGPDVADDYFHGTHLAGIVAAACNNGVGGCGVAPGVRVMACKFLDARGNGYTSDAVRCLNYAVKNKADVTLNSYGGLAADSAALKAAIAAAQDAGQLFVAAAGNDYGTDIDAAPTYPAAYDMPAVLAVAATDGSGRLANFSNYGAERVAIAAPGVSILSTVPGGGYARHDGTSQAAAQVAGAVALLLSARRGAGYKTARAMSVREDLLAAARPLPDLKGKVAAGGVLDVAAAMARMPTSGPVDPKESAWLVGVAESGGGKGATATRDERSDAGDVRVASSSSSSSPSSGSNEAAPPSTAAAPQQRAAASKQTAPTVSAFPRATAAGDGVGAGVGAAAARAAAPLLPLPLFG